MMKDEKFILFSDVKQLFIRSFKPIVLGALLFGAIGFFARAQVPVEYGVKATFKDGGKTTPSQAHIFESLLKSMSAGGERGGGVLMTSSLVLEPVIKKMGLQATVDTDSNWTKAKKQFINALRAEKRKPLKTSESFVFENVSYLGFLPKTYDLFFFAKDQFEIRDHKKVTLLKGEIGKKVFLEGISLTIKSIPHDTKLCTPYPLTIHPIQETILTLRSQIDVVQNPSNPGILELELLHTDLFFGKEVLNLIMDEYQKYLTQESERVSQEQIVYLEKRRDELCLKMNEHLQAHVAYLKNTLQEKGSLTLGQSLLTFQERKEKFSKDLLDLKFKRGQLLQGEALSVGQEMVALQSSLHGMMKERDELSLALFNTSSQEKRIATHLFKLDQVEREKLRVKTGIDMFFVNLLEPIQEERRLALASIDFGTIFLPETTQLKKIQEGKRELVALAKKDFSPKLIKSYLENNIRLLSLQEEALEKRLLSGATTGEEYRGIDIHTARKLLLDYLHKRDDLVLKYRQMELGRNQFEKKEMEHTSLAELFPDTTAQGLMRELGEMTQQLRKKRAFTEREAERIEKRFSSKKDDLLRHMSDTMEIALLEKERVEERIHAIQGAILDLVGQEMTLIEKQIEDRIGEKLKALDQEEKMIQGELECIKREMEGIPDHWLREKELSFSADMNQGMLEALVQLVESKSIESNLSMIESKPINAACASIIPKSPLLKVFGLVGVFIGGVIIFAGYFIAALYKGFPLSLKNIAARGRNVVGTLTSHSTKDLEIFRNLSLLLQKQSHFPLVVTLILGKGDDYSSSFAHLLAKEGKRLLVVDLKQAKTVKEKNVLGLAPYLAGEIEEPNLQKKDFGDSISLGKDSLYSQELLKSKKFEAFLEKMKQRFDVILLTLDTEAKQTLSKQFFSQSDVITLRLKDESYDELLPYFNWEDKRRTLAFLA